MIEMPSRASAEEMVSGGTTWMRLALIADELSGQSA